jgi:hypothetical protein
VATSVNAMPSDMSADAPAETGMCVESATRCSGHSPEPEAQFARASSNGRLRRGEIGCQERILTRLPQNGRKRVGASKFFTWDRGGGGGRPM